MVNKKQKTVNEKALDLWLGDGAQRLLELATGAGLSVYTIYRMRAGHYIARPKPFTRRSMVRITGIPEEQLFPFMAEENAKHS